MKGNTPKENAQRQEWVLAEAEKLRQECNDLTDEQRRKARQHALKLIYGTHATTPAGRH